jgi:hypothetical protein
VFDSSLAFAQAMNRPVRPKLSFAFYAISSFCRDDQGDILPQSSLGVS